MQLTLDKTAAARLTYPSFTADVISSPFPHEIMNWVRNNRFLAAFLAFMVVGVGGLGLPARHRALGRYQQVATDYNTQVAELKRLQALEPYPDAASSKSTAICARDIRRRRERAPGRPRQPRAAARPGPPPTPIQFQDRLRQDGR